MSGETRRASRLQLGPLTMVKEQATERADLETALARIPEAEAFVDRQLKRIEPFFPLRRRRACSTWAPRRACG